MALNKILFDLSPFATDPLQNIRVEVTELRERIRTVEARTLQIENTTIREHNETYKNIKVMLSVAACATAVTIIRLIALYFKF